MSKTRKCENPKKVSWKDASLSEKLVRVALFCGAMAVGLFWVWVCMTVTKQANVSGSTIFNLIKMVI